MPEAFSERVDKASSIKGVLDQYPYGNGLLREQVQNSDDAGATTQVFILDYRQHASQTVLDPVLEKTQGPALLSMNDSVFRESDWDALRTIHGSNKKMDENKIGKYGLGFRSNYHVTDNPHILSANKLVVFDPHDEFESTPGGASINIAAEGGAYSDQLNAFSGAIPNMAYFTGTVVRLPLRTIEQGPKSRISQRVVSPDDILELFNMFIGNELKEIMLFLKNVHTIELQVINTGGIRRSLAKVSVREPELVAHKRALQRASETHTDTFKLVIDCDADSSTAWRVYHIILSDSETASIMSSRMGVDVGDRLKQDKLFAHVAIAFPLDAKPLRGRLFTRLPLPIHTDLPAHIHGIFALTSSRQDLRNREETGSGSDSRERLLVEWNLFIFEVAVARLWAMLLEIVVREGEVIDPWTAWPSLAHTTNTYWSGLPAAVIDTIVAANTPVFPKVVPLGTSQSFLGIRGALVVREGVEVHDTVLQVFAKAGVDIIRLPSFLGSLGFKDISEFNSSSVYNWLKRDPSAVERLDAWDRKIVLDYLLGPYDSTSLQLILHLPLILTSSGHYIALQKSTEARYILAGPDVINLFHTVNDDLVCADRLDPRLVRIIGSTVGFNVKKLLMDDLKTMLVKRLGGAREGSSIDDALSAWLRDLWRWVDNHASWTHVPVKQDLLRALSDLPLLPLTTNTLRRVACGYLSKQSSAPTQDLLIKIGVPFLDSGITDQFLREMNLNKPEHCAHFVLEELDQAASGVIPGPARVLLRAYFAQCARSFPDTALQVNLVNRLKTLPVFPILCHGAIPPSCSDGPLLSSNIVFVKDSQCPLPNIENTTFVDVSDGQSHRDISLLVDRSSISNGLNELALLSKAIAVLGRQPIEDMDVIMSRIGPRMYDFGRDDIARLMTVPFVPVDDGSRRVPLMCVDKTADVHVLFDGESGWWPVGRYTSERFVAPIRSHFIRSLTTQVVQERITYLSSYARDTTSLTRKKAEHLVHLLDKEPIIQCSSQVLQQSAWLPTHNQSRFFKSTECRSPSSKEEVHLFDLVIPTVSVPVRSNTLRQALGWNRPPSLDTVMEQLRQNLNQPISRARYTRAVHIIVHLSGELKNGRISKAQLEAIQTIVENKHWVPVMDSMFGECVGTQHAVLSSSLDIHGSFKRVNNALLADDVVLFMKALGCNECPTVGSLVEEIRNLSRQGGKGVGQIISLLEYVADKIESSGNDEIRDMLVPVESREYSPAFQPLRTAHYDDTNDGQYYPSHPYTCHRRISQDLANRLGIPSAQELQLDASDESGGDIDNIEMGEDFCLRIANLLQKDYDIQYALNEFLANAHDAGAQKFSIAIDERTFPQTSLISPQLAQFQGPALILYNDALFTTKDFEGIRRTGAGGKKDDPDSIGKFGLGALTMFHYTDAPTIVSGGQILMLDPSGEYLPMRRGARRTTIFRTIKSVSAMYADQMAPFDGLYGYSSATQQVEGTIFRLPLRAIPGHLSSTVHTPASTLELIQRSYWELAQSSLLFTNLVQIDALRLLHNATGQMQKIQLWKALALPVTPVVDAPSANRSYTASHTKKSIQVSEHGCPAIVKSWFVGHLKYPVSSVPAVHSDVLRRLKLSNSRVGVQVGLAFPLQRHKQDPFTSMIFSMTCIPTTTGLPMHVNGPFVLSSDRRNVRYETQVTDAYEYNKWLLQVPIVHLMQYSLAHINGVGSSLVKMAWSHWPTVSPKEPMARDLLDKFFETLPQCEYELCPTRHGNLLAPANALLQIEKQDISSRVYEVLLSLPVDCGFIDPPRYVLSRMKTSGFATASPQVILDILRSQEDSFRAWVSRSGERSQLESVVNCLLDAKLLSLGGLPLLALQNKSFVDVPQLGDGTTLYFHPRDISAYFPSAQFLSATYHSSTIKKLIAAGIPGIKTIDGEVVAALIQGRLGTMPRTTLSPDMESWVEQIWDAVLGRLGDDNSQILPSPSGALFDGIPLFRTLKSTTSGSEAVSRAYALQNAVLPPIASFLGDSGRSIPAIVDKLGILVLASYPENREYFKLEDFSLPVLVMRLASTGTSITSLCASDQAVLATWMRYQMGPALKLLPPYENVDMRIKYRKLPIWPARRSGRDLLASADDIIVLPSGVRFGDVESYLEPAATFSERTTALLELEYKQRYLVGVKKRKYQYQEHPLKHVTHNNVGVYIRLPAVVLPHTEQELRRCLEVLLKVFPGPASLSVPDGTGRLRIVGELYDHTEQFFTSSFQDRADHFVHPNFRTLLITGLRRVIDYEAVEACIAAIDKDVLAARQDEAALVRRATLVFSHFKRLVPYNILNTTMQRVSRFHGRRFVPRLQHHMRGTLDIADYSTYRPAIVSPDVVVLVQNAGVCWSQYALCDESNMNALLLLPGHRGVFATISVQCVVAHLLVLTQAVAKDHGGDLSVLADITATYKWLNDHDDNDNEVTNALKPHRSKPIFLNVDDPKQEPWHFSSALSLVFNLQYDQDEANLYTVRGNLLGRHDLLRRAGVQTHVGNKIILSQVPKQDAMCILAAQRDNGAKFCDAQFTPEDALTDGQSVARLKWHKNIVCGLVPHLDNVFNVEDAMEEARTGKVMFPGSYFGACAVLDFLYTGCVNTETMGAQSSEELRLSNLLGELLRLLDVANQWDMKGFADHICELIHNNDLLTPGTYQHIYAEAKKYRAGNLIQYCEDYEKSNRELLARLSK